MVFLAPGGCPERPSPPPGFQQRRPSRAGRTRGFAQWAERRRPGMESAALRYAALAGSARRPGPRGAALAGSPRLQLALVPSDWQCVAPEREGILEVLEAPCSPAWGSPFVHFAPPGEGSDFAFSAASSAGAASGHPDREIPAVAMAPGTCCGGRPPAAPVPGCAASPPARRGEGTSGFSSPRLPPRQAFPWLH